MARLHRLWQKDFNSFHVFLCECMRVCVCGGRVCNSGAGFDCLGKGFVGISFNAFFSLLLLLLLLRKFGLRFSYVCMMLLSVGWLVSSFVWGQNPAQIIVILFVKA